MSAQNAPNADLFETSIFKRKWTVSGTSSAQPSREIPLDFQRVNKESIMSWRDWFKQPTKVVVQYKLVEVKAPRTPLRWDASTKEAVSTLQSHPGFLALCERLALQRARLETQLSHDVHKDLREVDMLQAGIYWCSWLQEQVEKATVKGSTKTFDAMEDELAAFKEIERVCEVPKV